MQRSRLVAFTGAGVSAESGLRTFRDSDGLWEEYPVHEVATPEAWARDPQRVLRFYDLRRAQVLNASPNAAHEAIAALEAHFDVQVITQNIDDLHERAGSSRVMHLHGEILKARSTADPSVVVPIEGDRIPWGARCPLGSQLRPHIVWFGEEVPLMADAPTSWPGPTSWWWWHLLQVWPAAGLVDLAAPHCAMHVVDPAPVHVRRPGVVHWNEKASLGMPRLAETLLREV